MSLLFTLYSNVCVHYSLVAIARLVIGVWHVFDHLSGVTLNPSHEIASAQVAIDLTSIIGGKL